MRKKPSLEQVRRYADKYRKSPKGLATVERFRTKYRTDETYRQLNLNKQGARRFGITPEEYGERMARPCEICGITSPRVGRHQVKMVLDHDHQTGEIRGTLCARCNAGVGVFREDPRLIAAAVAYLSKYLIPCQQSQFIKSGKTGLSKG